MSSVDAEERYGAPDGAGMAADAALDDAVHALAQPLTALSFVIDLACLRSEPAAWRQALETARTECRRAIAALEEVRAAALEHVYDHSEHVERKSW